MDLVENATRAGADVILIEIIEEPDKDQLSFVVEDNGSGMEPELAQIASDPFCTTRTTRRVGLGLSLLKANAELCGGGLNLQSAPGQGTRVEVRFTLSHIDRQPLGDWQSTIAGLILTQPEVDFVYSHKVGHEEFELDTRELRRELGKEALTDPAVTAMLREQMKKALVEMGSRA